ncbi:hypothetical protein THASP1DRAFT_17334, partial [Thamnocephalis sphaerospora]
MSFKARAVLLLCAAVCTAIVSTLSGVSAQGCSRIVTRQEIRTLGDRERNAYLAAIQRLQSGNKPTRYDQFTSMHLQVSASAHGYPQFLPWHRYYLREFEKALQAIDRNIVLPYWDWSYDSQVPHLSPIFRPDWYGGPGNPNNNYCVTGRFAGWSPSYPQPHCLRRRFDRGAQISAFSTPEQVEMLKRVSTDYNQFRVRLEGAPHARVHVQIGDQGTDMSTMASPNDPIFWLHHTFVDKVWADWQDSNPAFRNNYLG